MAKTYKGRGKRWISDHAAWAMVEDQIPLAAVRFALRRGEVRAHPRRRDRVEIRITAESVRGREDLEEWRGLVVVRAVRDGAFVTAFWEGERGDGTRKRDAG